MTAIVDFRKPKVCVVEFCISQSGKYYCFLGSHYHAGHTCWVFGSSNKVTGEITMRHYNTRYGAIAPKAQCETDWRKYKEGMLAKPKADVEEDAAIQNPWERTKRKPVRTLEELMRKRGPVQ